MPARFLCPRCGVGFGEAGFCPQHGVRLVHATPTGSDDDPTNVSRAYPGDGGGDRHDTAAAFGAISGLGNAKAALDALAEKRKPDYEKLVGQTLDGRYQITAKLGEGGMGVVYAARHTIIEKAVAIKVLKREVMRDAATVQRFVQEAKAASRIGHPNIVDVTDFGQTPDGMTFQVMEFVDGKTLGTVIRSEAPLEVDRALKIAIQIARALGAAHDKGIVHRDLKPDNVFVTARDGKRDFVKICDFGIAKVSTLEGGEASGPRLTRAGAVFGTPEYMAPEQAAGKAQVDGRVDVYALGIILYEMVTGRVPFKEATVLRTMAAQMLEAPRAIAEARPDQNYPLGLWPLLRKALEKKPEHRIATMAEFATALGELGQSLPGYRVEGTFVGGAPQVPSSGLGQLSGPASLVSVPAGNPPFVAQSDRGRRARQDSGAAQSIDDFHRSRRPSEAAQGYDYTSPGSVGTSPGTASGGAYPSSRSPEGEGSRSHHDSAAPPRAHAPSWQGRPAAQDAVNRSAQEDVRSDAPKGWRAHWPIIFFGLASLGVVAAVAAYLVKAKRDEHNAPLPIDAAFVDGGVVDATALHDAAQPDPVDAKRSRYPDARTRDLFDARAPVPETLRDAGPFRDGGGNGDEVTIVPVVIARNKLSPLGLVGITVLSKPPDALVFLSGSYRGRAKGNGLNLEEVPGRVGTIKCTSPGYADYSERVVFDGENDTVICVLKRKKVCTPGLKQPFDECGDAPTGAPDRPASTPR